MGITRGIYKHVKRGGYISYDVSNHPTIKRMGQTQGLTRGIYQHTKSGRRFWLDDIARCHTDPTCLKVIYSSRYNDILSGSKPIVHLPFGTVWIRDLEDFKQKFKLIEAEDRNLD